MYKTMRRKHRKSKKIKLKSIGFKRRLGAQKRKSKKYNSFRVSRGGIRL